MKTWLSADYHFGESRFDLMGRPFKTVDEHNDAIINNHNAVVSPEDEVIVIGDVCYQKAPEYLPLVKRLNGRKILIRGNHDRVFSDILLKMYFYDVIDDGAGYYHTFNDVKCYITHYPTEGVVDAFNLVGHIHGAWKYQLNMLNVGVDVNHFRPVDSATIPFHKDAICKYYDNDVWVAYNMINAAFKGKRGKAGSYFRPLTP